MSYTMHLIVRSGKNYYTTYFIDFFDITDSGDYHRQQLGGSGCSTVMTKCNVHC